MDFFQGVLGMKVLRHEEVSGSVHPLSHISCMRLTPSCLRSSPRDAPRHATAPTLGCGARQWSAMHPRTNRACWR